MFHTLRRPDVLVVTLAAAGILMVTMGVRQSFGLFVSPLNSATGMGVATVSLALAIGQLSWGAIQPVAGALADRYGVRVVLVAGRVVLAVGCALTPFVDDGFGAMWAMALAAVAALPLVGRRTAPAAATAAESAPGSEQRLGPAVRAARKDRSYLLLHAGFFTCGFHIAFLVTHLPGEVDLCGLPAGVASTSLAIIGLANVFGSLFAGSWVGRYRSKHVLALMYGSRALLIAWYLLMPPSEWTFYLFAAGLGFTWLATVPPTAAIVGKLFGTRYLATLFGLTLLSHQIGGFLGAWLGGLALRAFGDFTWMWYADMALALAAALVNLPIREARVQPLQARAA